MKTVLFIDDKCKQMAPRIDSWRDIYNICLIPFKSFPAALKALKDEPHRFDAVIVDFNVIKGNNTLCSVIEKLQVTTRIHPIPFFVTSANDSVDTDEYNERVYDKFRDEKELLEDLKIQLEGVAIAKFKELYPREYETLLYLDMPFRYLNSIANIMVMLCSNQDVDRFRLESSFNQIRKLVEVFFRMCVSKKLMPTDFITNDNVNVNQCYNYLSGNVAKILHLVYGDKGESILPERLSKMLEMTLLLTNRESHTGDDQPFFEENLFYVHALSSCASTILTLYVWLQLFTEKNSDVDFLSKCVRVRDWQDQKNENIYRDGYMVAYHSAFNDAYRDRELQEEFQMIENTGYEMGLADGNDAGYERGFQDGYNDGFYQGREEGYLDFCDELDQNGGYSVGYNDGYIASFYGEQNLYPSPVEGEEYVIEIDSNNIVHCGCCLVDDSFRTFEGQVAQVFDVVSNRESYNTECACYRYYAKSLNLKEQNLIQ